MRYFIEPTTQNPKYPCGICSKNVSQRHRAIQCDSCNFWNHIKCDQIDTKTYEELKKSNNVEKYYCKLCKEENSENESNNSNPQLTPTSNTDIPNVENQEYHCRICSKKVGHKHKAVQCDLCDYWNHIKCDGIDNKTYETLKKSDESEKYLCKLCKEETFVFQKLSDDEFFTSIVKNIDIKEDLNLRISPTSTLKTLFNDFSSHNKDEPSPISCSYYDISTRIPYARNCNHSMFHLNLASLGLHKEELVTSLSLLEFEFDMIAISETRIIAGIDPIYDLSLNGYNHYQTPTECDKGGVIIYVKNYIDIKRRTDLEEKMYKSCELESVFLEIINEGKKNEIFGCVYRHPTMSIDYFNKTFFNEFIDKLASENKVSYLSGDFNIDLLKIETDTSINDFYNSLTSNLFVPHITLPTRITSHSQTLIDNIYSNDPHFAEGVSGNFTFSISDHLAQFLIMPRKDNRLPKKHNFQRRNLKNYDKAQLVADVIDINWPEVLSIERGDAQHSYEMFNKKMNEILDTHVPLKKLNKKELRLQAKPWITPGIVKSIKRRDKLLRKFITTKEINRKNELHTQYKTLRNQIVSIIRKSKKLHYQTYFTENAKDIRKTWTGIKNIINIRTLTKGQPTSMLIDKNLITDPTKIAEGFNSYFSSIAEKLQQNLSFGDNNFMKYLNQPLNNNFLFKSADTNEIILIIVSLENSKATGPNSIPTEILKLIKPNICYPLKELINLSFATGVYPDLLKIAEVIPIFKNKGDQLLVSNYRPISLLSNINKIFEKLVYSRLYSFLTLHNCIYELQFGFRAKHSTNHALLSLTEMIREALDESNFACGIFIDLQKAFDTVDHQILLKKLEYYGIRGIANNWFRSYLTNRQQFVSVNGFNSKQRTMNYGVPQGSVLGPLLFLIYINDLSKAIKFCTTHHFADDTNLLFVDKSLKKIQKYVNLDLKFLCKWLKANKISLNASKTELIIFRDPKKISKHELKIKIDGKKLIPSRFVKYLGVLIDCHLTWKAHAMELHPKLSRAIGMLCKIRHFVNHETLCMIYYGIFSSILMYGSQIWGHHEGVVKKLQILQNKALRIMNFCPPRTSATPLFKNCEILKLTDYISLQDFMYVHDNMKGNLPVSLTGNFSFVNTVNNTRSELYHQVDKLRTRTILYGSKSIKSKSVEIWNFINEIFYKEQLHEKSRQSCKIFLKKFFIECY